MVLTQEIDSRIQPVKNCPEVIPATRDVLQPDLHEHAQALWSSIQLSLDPHTFLPADRIYLHSSKPLRTPVTSPTNIGLTLLSVVAARELGLISSEFAAAFTTEITRTLTHLSYPNQLPLNWYHTETGQPLTQWPDNNSSVPLAHSSVDTAWFVAGLYGASQAFPHIQELTQLLHTIDLGQFYNSLTHLCVGELALDGVTQTSEYGALSETRIISLLGVGLNQIPPDHLTHLWHYARQLQQQRYPQWPEVHPHTVPTWGGSMFEMAMPSLIFNEARLAPHIWKESHYNYVATQQHFAEPHHGLWGYSPASTPSGYLECGVKELGLWGQGYELGNETDTQIEPIITPHALYLALLADPSTAIQGLHRLIDVFPRSWSCLGLPDSFNAVTGAASDQLLVLDQCMGFLALAQYLYPESVRHFFAPLEDNLIPLLSRWHFDTSG